ncbi:hypothetical protein Tco_0454911 [Tanacetum coccineum]
MKIQDLIEKRIEKAGQHLNKEKQIMHINKGKEKMVMERVTSDESFDDTLKSSSEDTCSSDCTWEQKKASKDKLGSRSTQAKKAFYGKQGSSSAEAKKLLFHQILYNVLTKRPPPVTNYVLGLTAVTTWQQILNKEFGIISSKEDVGGSSNVRSKGKRKML